MSKKKRMVIHVVPHNDTDAGKGWGVKLNGELFAVFYLKNRKTKKDAIAAAVRGAKKNQPSQVVIHKRDGTIQEERTFGDDPVRSKG